MKGFQFIILGVCFSIVVKAGPKPPIMPACGKPTQHSDVLGKTAMVDRNYILNRLNLNPKTRCRLISIPSKSQSSRSQTPRLLNSRLSRHSTRSYLCQTRDYNRIQMYLSEAFQCRHLNFSQKYKSMCLNRIFTKTMHTARKNCQRVIWKSKTEDIEMEMDYWLESTNKPWLLVPEKRVKTCEIVFMLKNLVFFMFID